MASMSYCKFENTYNDLELCWEEWELTDEASEYEVRAKENIIALIKEISESLDED